MVMAARGASCVKKVSSYLVFTSLVLVLIRYFDFGCFFYLVGLPVRDLHGNT